jgi:site-specific recombinase XerD
MYRIHVLAELQYAAGLRISEAAGLQVQDVDLERGLIHVHNGKGGYDRVCFLNEYCVRVLKLYIQRIRPLVCSVWNKDSDRLFNTGRVWWFGHSVNEALRKIGAQEGFPNFTSHTLRHALGYHLLRAGAPIRSIQQILGHRRLRNTEVYTKVDKEDLKSVLDAKHPRQWRQMC